MYLINPALVKKGDIFLTRSNSRESELIRKSTGSDYSHCILYLGAYSCIESDGLGVQVQNIQRIIFENSNDVLVLRLREKVPEPTIDEIIGFARQKVGTEYSGSEARAAMLQIQSEAHEPNRQFCTRFVAQAYNEANLKIAGNPNYCTPKDIQSSPLLEAVANVMKEATIAEEQVAKEENTPLRIQADIHNYIFENARNFTKQDIQTFDQLTQHLLDNPEDDGEIVKILKASGFLTMWQMDIQRNPWFYDIKIFKQHFPASKWQEIGAERAKDELTIRERFIINRKGYIHCYQFWHQQYFKLLIELYSKLIELSEQRERIGRLASGS